MSNEYEDGYQDALNDVWDEVLSCYEKGVESSEEVWEILQDLGIKRREE